MADWGAVIGGRHAPGRKRSLADTGTTGPGAPEAANDQNPAPTSEGGMG